MSEHNEASKSENVSAADALAAIESIRSARGAAANRMMTPWWFDLFYALPLGGIVTSVGLQAYWAVGLCALLVVIYAIAFRQRTGLWVSGFTPDSTRWVVVALVFSIVACLILAMVGRDAGFQWAPYLAGLVAAVAGFVASRRWVKAYADGQRGPL